MSPNENITAVILTRNEAENLPRCLASLTWCHEIVVVDSGSSDDTVKCAIMLGARILLHVQPPPFRISEQRNWALDFGEINTSWVLFIDADEVVPSRLAAELHRVCNDANNKYDG